MKRNNAPLSAEDFNRLRDLRASQSINKAPKTTEYSLEAILGATALSRDGSQQAEVTQVFKSEDTQILEDINATQVYIAVDERRNDEAWTTARVEATPEPLQETTEAHRPEKKKAVTPPPAPPLQEGPLLALMKEVEAKPLAQDERATEFLGVINDDVPPSTSVWLRNLGADQTEIIDEYEPPETLRPARTTRRRMGKSAFISLSIFTAGAVMIVPAMGANMTSQYIYGNKDMSMSERFEDGWSGTVDFYKGIVGLGE